MCNIISEDVKKMEKKLAKQPCVELALWRPWSHKPCAVLILSMLSFTEMYTSLKGVITFLNVRILASQVEHPPHLSQSLWFLI